jgi:transposase
VLADVDRSSVRYVRKGKAITGDATLTATVEPRLCTRAATMDLLSIYDRTVLRHARQNETVRHLMSRARRRRHRGHGCLICIETPDRFTFSSGVGAYLGMRPSVRRGRPGRPRVSGRGDSMVRGLLFEAVRSS